MPKGLRLRPDPRSLWCPIGTKGSADVLAPDRVIAELAERQHGVVARRQLLSLGLTPDQIKGRIRRTQLHAVHRGVYAVGYRLLGAEGRWMAAVLACGSEAVLSHRSAAALWQVIPRFRGSIEVTRARGWRAPQGLTIHRGSLPADETDVVDGIPVTGLARTFLDLASVVSRHRVEKALNEAEVRALVDKLSIPDLLERYPRRRGTALLRELLDDIATVRGVTRRELEDRFAALLDTTDLPRPRLNAHVAAGERFFEADCLWEAQGVIVELDGWQSHGTARAFENDRERDRLLLVNGWRVMRVTWRQLHDDAPAVIADLRRLLRA